MRRELEAERARLERTVSDLGKQSGPGARELEELRRTVANLSSDRSRGRGDPVGGVPGNLEILEQRLDTVAKTVATTSAGLASKDGELAALRRQLEEEVARVAAALAEVRAAVDPAPVAELRLTVKELSDQTAAVARRGRHGLDGLDARVESLAGQLETLGQTVAATAGGLASGERDLSTLRAAFDEETGRLDSHVASIEQALATTTSQFAALGELADRDSVEALEERARMFAEQHQALAGRLDALAHELQETGRGYAERELELAALSRRFEEAQAGVEGLVAEVRSEVRALAEAGATDALETRLEGLTQQVEELGGRLLRLDEASAGVREEASSVRAELAGALEQVAGRIEALEREHAHASGELARALEASAEEREELAGSTRLLEERVHGFAESMQAVSGRLEALSSAVEESGQGDAARERELAALSRRFEEGRVQVDALVSDLRQALETMPVPGPDPELVDRVGELALRLDAIAAEVQSSATREETDRLLGRLLLRLDSVEHAQETLTGELARSTSAAAPVENDVTELRGLVEALGERLAAGEREVARLPDTQELTVRIDEVTRRLDQLEHRDQAPVAAEAADGRLRLELRALELRVEHAEDVARENREAVLTQLERLASRIEWRLQRLEDGAGSTEVATPSPTESGAQVVPIRGSEV
jgi:chromosome segregation ATPase